MNVAEAGNTFGIIVDLTMQLGYTIKLDVDYSDDTVINYWLGMKDNKMFLVDFPTKLLGFASLVENEPDGLYAESESFEEKAINHAKSLGYQVERRDDGYKAAKEGASIKSVYGFNPFSLLSMIQIAEEYGAQWQRHISNQNYEAILDETCLEMPIEDIIYIQGRGFALTGKIQEGRVYRGTHIRVVDSNGETKIANIKVDGLEVFGCIPYAAKGDNIALSFTSPHPAQLLKKIYPIEKGDMVLYANVPLPEGGVRLIH